MATDLGALLQSSQNGDNTGIINLLNRLNLPLTQQTTQFLGDVQDMQIASGRTGLLDGWSLPAGADSRNDFFALMTDAEGFAAASGWQYFPTPLQLQWAVEHGVAQMSQQQVWTWMAGLNPAGTKDMPWLSAGMNQQNWKDYGNRLGDVWSQYTGNAAPPSDILAKAARENWSAQHFQQWLQSDPGVTGQYGWVKHGMTYNDFQQYKINNKSQVASRFGQHAGDSQYLTMLNDPLTPFNAQGAQVSSTSQASPGAANFGRMSAVR